MEGILNVGDKLKNYTIFARSGLRAYLGTDDNSHKETFIKQIPYSELNKQRIVHLQSIKHENLLPIIDFIEKGEWLYVVYEYCEEGALEKYITQNKGKQKDKEASKLINQLILGYKELYDRNLLHQNLKPSNIYITYNLKNEVIIKLGDFGFIRNILGNKELYTAPEVLFNKYEVSISSDMWSIGAITFFILQGTPPFTSWGEFLISDMQQGNYAVNQDLSRYCIDFICMCLQYKVDKRMTFEKMIEHPFVTGRKYKIVEVMKEGPAIKKAKIYILEDNAKYASSFNLSNSHEVKEEKAVENKEAYMAKKIIELNTDNHIEEFRPMPATETKKEGSLGINEQ